MIKKVVALEQIASDYKSACSYSDVPSINNKCWFDYFDSVKRIFEKKYDNYTAADIYKFFVDITDRELKQSNVSNGIATTYLQRYIPDMFENIKYWPVKYTTAQLVNEQFKLLRKVLLKSKKITEKKIDNKVVEVISYDTNMISEFEFHVQRYGKLLGTYWDYRKLDPSVIEEALVENNNLIERAKIREQKYQAMTKEEVKKLYSWANDKFNLELVIV